MECDMRKGLLTVLAFAFATLFLSGCKYNKVDNLADKVIGKWMAVERNDSPLLTNMSHIVTFISATEAYTSTSWIDLVGMHDMSSLDKKGKSGVVIKGNKISKTVRPNSHITVVDEMKVSSITDNDMYGNNVVKTYIDGVMVTTSKYTSRYKKVTDNFEQAILGLWEGQVTSEMGSDFSGTDQHRWEFLPDGNYRFYYKTDGQWLQNDEFAQYIIDGTMLCCRWKNIGLGQEEHHEWWIITSIENGVMNWSAIRERPDGTTYTSTVSMKRVN